MFVSLSHCQSYLVDPYMQLWEVYGQLREIPHKTLIVVNSNNQVMGTITPGDFNRLSISRPSVSVEFALNQEAQDVMLSECCRIACSSSAVMLQEIEATYLNLRVNHRVIPVVDSANHLLGLYVPELNKKHAIQIGGLRPIKAGVKPIIIAEVGVNHNGDLNIAKRLIIEAKKSGADIVKFQLRSLPDSYVESALNGSSDLSVEYTVDHLLSTNLSFEQISELFTFSREAEMEPICTAFDIPSLEFISSLNPCCYKLASCDITNFPLLEAISCLGKPVIMSTGMSSENEIVDCYNYLSSRQVSVIVLHCVSAYPAPYEHLNLKYISYLEKLLGAHVGYSSHDKGILASAIATSFGATIIEKHITFDTEAVGPDHKASLMPQQFSELVSSVQAAWEATAHKRGSKQLTQIELLNKQNLSKTLYLNQAVSKGQKLHPDMFITRSPGGGVSPMFLPNIANFLSKSDLKEGKMLFPSDIQPVTLTKNSHTSLQSVGLDAQAYKWGYPVRYRDVSSLLCKLQPALIEFHLTYRDLDAPIPELDSSLSDISISYHCPECFEDDHLLDLTNTDSAYRSLSISHLQRVVDHIAGSKLPRGGQTYKLVTNIGGFTRNDFLRDDGEIANRYSTLTESLNQIDFKNVHLCIQTMPPYPWHLGGRSHHNLFVHPDKIIETALAHRLDICIDISHTYMACNYLNIDFYDAFSRLLSVSSYLHVSDCTGSDQEGLQIGQGDIDFVRLNEIIRRSSTLPVDTIVEIWQGHLDTGSGFVNALELLAQHGW